MGSVNGKDGIWIVVTEGLGVWEELGIGTFGIVVSLLIGFPANKRELSNLHK